MMPNNIIKITKKERIDGYVLFCFLFINVFSFSVALRHLGLGVMVLSYT